MNIARSRFVVQGRLSARVKGCRSRLGHFIEMVMALAMVILVSLPAHAVQETSTGGKVSWFYAITHLHPAAYFILFLILVLSAVNLVFQGWISADTWPFRWIMTLMGGVTRQPLGAQSARGIKRARRDLSSQGYQGYAESVGAGVVGLPRACNSQPVSSKACSPTPLDGVNHPMPRFSGGTGAQIGIPRIVERQDEKKAAAQDFRFSAAVDVPSAQELERREKEQLVVSGSIRGLDSKGIPAVIVYLTDGLGNRIGQSCRSLADTGEFKVLVNETGSYFLNAYKRGYVLESSEAMALPIQSGKIEGYHVRMIPEGCIVQGRVLDSGGESVPDLEVKCVCRTGDVSRFSRTDSDGRFRISGIPVNSECYVEAVASDGRRLGRLASFQTVQKREIYQELILRPQVDQSPASSSQKGQTRVFPEKKDSEKEKAVSAPATAAP